jgi:hypothetical protein
LATPFVQGRLRDERLSVEVETGCAHCGQGLHLTLDSELNWSIKESNANPLVFMPDVDWEHFEAPNIINDY